MTCCQISKCCQTLLLLYYIVELTVGYESNLQKNVQRKKAKYSQLISEQSEPFEKVKFINISINSIEVFAKECLTFINMLNDIGFDKNNQKYLIKRMRTIAIRTTYYVILLQKQGMDKSRTFNILKNLFVTSLSRCIITVVVHYVNIIDSSRRL